jgi:peptidoglycan/LPS O-acetylase OafA/YrhL
MPMSSPTKAAPRPTVGRLPPRSQSSDPTTGRGAALDGIRGLAALAVLGFHVWLYLPVGQPGPRVTLSSHILFELNMGLICFFVLSGYLLYRPFARAALTRVGRVNMRRYARRRAARILPAYYVCIAGALLAYWAVGASQMVPPLRQIALFAVFGQGYSIQTLTAIDAVTWTLCVEVCFYILLPLLGLIAYRLGPDRIGGQVALLLALIAATLTWNALVYSGGWGSVAAKTLPAYIGHFALGMLVALWAEHRALRAQTSGSATLSQGATALAVGAGLALVIATGYWHEHWGSRTAAHGVIVNLPAAAGFALVVAALACGRGPATAGFRWRPLIGAGLVSYGIYLWHIPVILVAQQLAILPSQLLPRLLVVLFPTLALATLSWVYLERPLILRAAQRRPEIRSQARRSLA